MPHHRDDEEDEQFPALHRSARLSHLRRSVRRRAAGTSPRFSRLVGLQYILLAVLIGLLFLFGPAFKLRVHPVFAGLVVLYLAGGLALLKGHRRRPPRT